MAGDKEVAKVKDEAKGRLDQCVFRLLRSKVVETVDLKSNDGAKYLQESVTNIRLDISVSVEAIHR